MKEARLILVAIDTKHAKQSNKFYNMSENSDGTFTATWGRVGVTSTSKNYPTDRWNKTLKSKLKKGYTDVTHLRADGPAKVSTIAGSSEVQAFIKRLESFAKKTVQANYTISAEAVTQAMIDTAQGLIDEIIPQVKLGAAMDSLNDKMLELFKTIPRAMPDVRLWLFKPLKNQEALASAKRKIGKEQDLLDTMSGQVSVSTASSGDGDQDLLAIMGIRVQEITDPKELQIVKNQMGPQARQFVRAFRVINNKTQKAYSTYKPRKQYTELLWHGSRNENWFNILQTGLLIRPSGAIYTGSMFGDGIYFADKFQKSLGYTSLRGSYWTGGSANTAMLALFETILGEQMHIHRHNSSHYRLDYNQVKRGGYDSVYAHGGADLRNNEYIVYTPNQCTIRYIVEIK